jgi:hypothetical protein
MGASDVFLDARPHMQADVTLKGQPRASGAINPKCPQMSRLRI